MVSRTEANAVSPTITVGPLSSVRGKAAERLVQPIIGVDESRLPKRSRALCDQVGPSTGAVSAAPRERCRLRLCAASIEA